MDIERALVSVYDKTGVVGFAKALAARNVEILSTGGTADLLKKNGVSVTEVSRVTGFPEMMDGRVKTLHPALHAGILALRDNPAHMGALKAQKFLPVDLVAVNLYPFEEALKNGKKGMDLIEMIDIGGPAMLRAAAKNFRFVVPVCDPSDYAVLEAELSKSGSIADSTRRRLAAKAFERTAEYDRIISEYFVGADPVRLTLDFEKISDLRYGENPHQKGALYAERLGNGIVRAKKLHGKELSFNNYLDLDAAFEMVSAFSEPACAIIKHTSPCGFAIAKDAASAFRAAYACDPLSAFGSIVGLNAVVDEKTASAVVKSGFIECVLAKDFTAGALKCLKIKKNLRLLSMPMGVGAYCNTPLRDFKRISGGLLVQERDLKDPVEKDLRCVTRIKPTRSEIKDLLFAFKVCRYVKSNAIVVVKGGKTVGLGMGQPSRVDSCFSALKKAGSRARRAVLASDGFFPKPDSIALAKKAGIRAVIQPGGSIQDAAVVQACDRAGIAMVFAGIRHFKH